MSEAQHVEGRPIAESRRLAEASLARYARIGEVWDDLTDKEQTYLVDLAERLTDGEVLR